MVGSSGKLIHQERELIMSQSGRLDTKELVQKIEKIMKGKMAQEEVVPLNQFRQLKKQAVVKTILVIEDDESVRKALQRIFESEGYRVKMAEDATQLSMVLDDTIIDLIVLDVGLPWVDGFELAQLLKEHRDLKKIPLIFVSGKTSQEDVRRGFEVGANDYIKKPFDIEKIKKTVQVLLKLSDKNEA